ncbi:phosphoenolpyruvate carboxylase [Microbispora triticiradicis]|uniref:Phosphoenolpyruvate carboxylase n=3 Tax=Microbispora TaxID=2005 RepID=A0ABY3M3X0_9ACTN|nr:MULTISPECIES: phosphoenolpyruvate carboxylase [Microbispora]RGA05889.1 phosphoenolpyruvate carboxylase [Microbispora triticiradicis]TLP62168.1 phosphoenolpyruvate carboxylase [Microbispora fusca]TYB66276.1 phosphoenolpyruvate carboxylase [Microbispora tritici]
MAAIAPAERHNAVAEMPDELRADVRLLGGLLGQVIAEHGGPDLLADVERLRKAVIAARRQETTADEVAALVAEWPVDRAVQIARAFTCYFHLANLAEEHYRVRTLRQRDKDDVPLRESLAEAVQRLRGDDRLQGLIDGLEFRPVLTAHPTEARRRAIVTAIQRISAQLDAYNLPGRGAAEREEAHRRLLEEIDLLWRTAQLRHTKLDPLDEVRTAMAAFDETLFRTVPLIYRSLDAALGPGTGTREPQAKAYIRYGSWIGGDRDGNPNVTAKVTREAMQIQAEHVLIALENATTRIGRSLTLAAAYTPPSADLRAALAQAEDDHPDLVSEMATRSPMEPHRQWLMFVAARIAATRRRDLDLAYRAPAELLADLRLAQDSLRGAGAVRQAYGELQHLVWQVETFGFHLAELEVRQHSAVHAAALQEIASGTLSERTEEVLATIRVIGWIQERFGVTACSRYVVSFTRSADDIAAVYELARHALGDRAPVLDVVPLFESGEDLDNSTRVLEGMAALEPVRKRLAANGRRMEVMLGYSDSAKELGPAAATLRLYDAQAALTAWAAANDVRLTLFHGRGGALGRGGGPANRAVLAQAPGSVAGRFKVTEQGEVIFARYGHSAIAKRHIEQVTNAVLLASTSAVESSTAEAAAKFRRLADLVASASERAYRALTEAPGFPEWFALVSPLEELGSLRLGSRPARRGLGAPRSLDDLRAIPWVFSWAQTRVNLPGWYGLGSGLAAVVTDGGMAELRAAYQEWPLFAAMLDNAEMSLAKTDRAIASRYLGLGGRSDFAEQVLEEYDLTRRLVLEVTGHDRLLENRRVLSRAVQLRDPYVDALSHLQLRALSALRASGDLSEEERERLSTLLLLSVNGVAAGLQNTG